MTFKARQDDSIPMMENAGEIAALVTALCWAFTAMSFEEAGKRIGSLTVNFLRLVFGFAMMGLYLLAADGHILPLDAGGKVWVFLSLSGLIGFALGDLFLFQAFVLIGARISMLIYASVPIITSLFGLIFLNEKLGLMEIAGMLLTVTGIAVVVLDGNREKRGKNNHFIKGIALAVLGSAGQAAGLIISKFGMSGYENAFGSNMIRIIAGMAGFAVIITFMKRWGKIRDAFQDSKGIIYTGAGSFFGPFLGVSLSLLAIRLTSAGVASTIMAIVPVLIIPLAVLIYKEKVRIAEIAGAFLAVTGVALLFL